MEQEELDGFALPARGVRELKMLTWPKAVGALDGSGFDAVVEKCRWFKGYAGPSVGLLVVGDPLTLFIPTYPNYYGNDRHAQIFARHWHLWLCQRVSFLNLRCACSIAAAEHASRRNMDNQNPAAKQDKQNTTGNSDRLQSDATIWSPHQFIVQPISAKYTSYIVNWNTYIHKKKATTIYIYIIRVYVWMHAWVDKCAYVDTCICIGA